jgi:alkylhydroperoxidase family enzyme
MSSVPRITIVDGSPVTMADVAPRLAAEMADFQRVAYPGCVDLVTRELVRIESGRLSHCRICRNLRLHAAIDRGFEESMVDALDDPEGSDLPDHQKAAVVFARAFLTAPETFDAAARTELLRHFTSEQIAELVLDLVRFRPGSKLTVAAGTEPTVEELVYL